MYAKPFTLDKLYSLALEKRLDKILGNILR
jgi:hypothetical protein